MPGWVILTNIGRLVLGNKVEWIIVSHKNISSINTMGKQDITYLMLVHSFIILTHFKALNHLWSMLLLREMVELSSIWDTYSGNTSNSLLGESAILWLFVVCYRQASGPLQIHCWKTLCISVSGLASTLCAWGFNTLSLCQSLNM